MTSFYGTESYAIDHKGRLTIPAEVRRPDGRKQPIKSFYFEADPKSPLATQKRYIVLFFDNSSMNLGDQMQARQAAAKRRRRRRDN